VEGADLVLAGCAAGRLPQVVFVQAERAEELASQVERSIRGLGGARPSVFPVAGRVAQKISTLETAPDVMAVFPLPEPVPLGSLAGRGSEQLVVYADGIADPGNMGTLVRAAVAFGAAALVASPGSADVFGPKTVRASMGALFGLPLYPDVQLGEALSRLRFERVYGLAAHGGAPIGGADLRRPAALVVGAERAGISPLARRHVTDLVTIPLAPALGSVVESLNAGVAGAIALYEFSRRLSGASDDQASAGPAAAKG
jgi:TrmH family RNA methyltransferase